MGRALSSAICKRERRHRWGLTRGRLHLQAESRVEIYPVAAGRKGSGCGRGFQGCGYGKKIEVWVRLTAGNWAREISGKWVWKDIGALGIERYLGTGNFQDVGYGACFQGMWKGVCARGSGCEGGGNWDGSKVGKHRGENSAALIGRRSPAVYIYVYVYLCVSDLYICVYICV